MLLLLPAPVYFLYVLERSELLVISSFRVNTVENSLPDETEKEDPSFPYVSASFLLLSSPSDSGKQDGEKGREEREK